MKRLIQYASLLLALTLSMLIGIGSALAQNADLSDLAGRYEIITQPQPAETGDKIEIVDVFRYGCPACYRFLPYMEYLEEHLPEYAEIRRLPAIFSDAHLNHARVYFTAHALGVADDHHHAFFDAIHLASPPIENEKNAIIDFYGKREGVDRGRFEEVWHSPAVEAAIRESYDRQQRYGIRYTPTLIVHGKYRVIGNLAGSYENMIAITLRLAEYEYLIKQMRKWPVQAHALALPAASMADSADLRIHCKHTDICRVYLDCSAQTDGTAFSGEIPPIPAFGAVTLKAADIERHTGGSSWGEKGRLGCALRSEQNISAQVWTRSGDGVLVNNSAFIRSERLVSDNLQANIASRRPQGGMSTIAIGPEDYHQADIESISSPDSQEKSNIRIRCRESTCNDVTLACFNDEGQRYTGNLDRIEASSVRHLQSEELSRLIGYRWSNLSLSCEIRSTAPFSVQLLTRTGGGGALVNNSAR